MTVILVELARIDAQRPFGALKLGFFPILDMKRLQQPEHSPEDAQSTFISS